MKKSFYFLKFTFIAIMLVAMNVTLQGQDYRVTVLNPSYPNIKWELGTTQTISWVDNFQFGVDVLLMNGTTTVTTIASNLIDESTYAWTVSATVSTGYKIRVQSHLRPNDYYDLSDNTFEIVTNLGDKLVLFQPNWTGIKWERGTTQVISWSDNFAGNVDLELWNGASKIMDIASVSHPNSTYDFAIPGTMTPSTTYKIIVRSHDFPAVEAIGMNFEIVDNLFGNITLIQPNWTGIKWESGTRHLISWVDNVPGPVDIYLLKGGTVTRTITTNVVHPNSTYEWDIWSDLPDGTDYQVKVISQNNPSVFSLGQMFQIVNDMGGKITLIQPNWTGIKWDRGKKHLISWVDNLEGPVDIILLKGGTSTVTIATVNHPETTWEWDIPAGQAIGSDYKIMIAYQSDPSIYVIGQAFQIVDVLDGVIVLQQPNVSGIRLLADNVSQYWISWVDNLPNDIDIDLYYATTAGGPYTYTSTITTITDELQTTYIWTPQSIYADDNLFYKIKLSCVGCAAPITDISDYSFKLLSSLGGEITLIQPTWTGVAWACESTQWISWSDNLAEPVKIELLKNNVWIMDIAASVPANESTYQWPIPAWNTNGIDIEGYVYKVKITSTTNPAISATSQNPFKLYQPVDISVYPNPCSEFTTLQFDNSAATGVYTVQIYNRFGTLVRTLSVENTDSMQATIPTYDLPNGIYLLNASSGEKNISKKIIVQH